MIYHAGTVLLNSLLDTVPGELVPAGEGTGGPWVRPGAGVRVRRRLGPQLAGSTSEDMEPQLGRYVASADSLHDPRLSMHVSPGLGFLILLVRPPPGAAVRIN